MRSSREVVRRGVGGRLVVLAVVAMLAIGGCGSDGDGDGDGEHASVRGAETGLTLDLKGPGEVGRGESITWSLKVVNHGERPVELVCPTGQDAEVELSRDGAVSYRWGEGRFFTQAVRRIRVDPGEMTIELHEDALDIGPGLYSLQAALSCDPAPEPARAELTVTPAA